MVRPAATVSAHQTCLPDTSDSVHGYLDRCDQTLSTDYLARDYKAFLLTRGAKPSTVNAALTAIDNYHLFLGKDRVKVSKLEMPDQAPRALDAEEQKRFLRALESCGSQRNQLIGLLLLNTGIRIAELAALNIGDVPVTARDGRVIVRCGKGMKHREVPLNKHVRAALLMYLKGRGQVDASAALFLAPSGERLSVRAVAYTISELGKSVGLRLSAHTLRHSCLTNLVRNGSDLITVSEIGGHARLETTRRYTRPSAADKAAAMERLPALAS